MRTREELAYAAGLFEGEGCVFGRKNRQTSSRQAGLQIQMTDPEPLRMFHEAVGLGYVKGPLDYPSQRGGKPVYMYRLTGFERVQAVIAMLWPWLGPRRRSRAAEVLGACKRTGRPRKVTA